MEKMYFIEHNTFVFELEGNMFPKGQLLYNVGFGSYGRDYLVHPCRPDPGYESPVRKRHSVGNYYELCGKTKNDGRKECWFKNRDGNAPLLIDEYQNIRSHVYYKPNFCAYGGTALGAPQQMPSNLYSIFCDSSTHKLKVEYSGNDNRFYTQFIAYAVGDILDPKKFSSPANKLDGWRINGSGYLEHCQNPFDNSTIGKCSRSSPMSNTEDDPSPYCGV